jgi:general secretion pathway protein G
MPRRDYPPRRFPKKEANMNTRTTMHTIHDPQPTIHAFQRRAAGFTLLELLVVVAIIGLLVGYVAPRYFSQVGKSEVQVARAQIDSLEKALDQYRLDTRRYPNAEQGLAALVTRPANEPNWGGPYLKRAVPNDPWGRPYVYRTPGQRGEFDLLSLGRDGKAGGSGEDADIGPGI